jgi:UDP-N-acetylmuramoyl-tripeptide--D-alanyl-D-alanine ligase
MLRLHEALPQTMRGEHRATSSEMADLIAGTLRPGDVVTVKGSLGSRMTVIVKRLLPDATASAAPSAAAE